MREKKGRKEKPATKKGGLGKRKERTNLSTL